MDLEKIIKLAKLANNNPNEHEANLAARKVCKLMEEGNYQLQFVPTVTGWSTVTPTSDWVTEELRKAEEKMRKRKEEENIRYNERVAREQREKDSNRQKWRANPNKSFGGDRPDLDWEWIPQRREFRHKRTGQILSETEFMRRPQDQVKKYRTCVSCKQDILTGYIGNVFTCYTCQWQKFQSKA